LLGASLTITGCGNSTQGNVDATASITPTSVLSELNSQGDISFTQSSDPLTREDAIYEAGSCKVHVYSQYGPADGDFNSNNWHEDIWMGEDKNTKN